MAGLVERVQAERPAAPPWYSWQVSEASAAPPGTAVAVRGRQVTRAGYVPGIPDSGIDESRPPAGASGTSRREMLQDLYDAYRTCPWVSRCVNAIAQTITAGGLESEWDQDDDEGDQKAPDKPPAVVALERFYAYCNDADDAIQVLRAAIVDLLVFGDGLLEIGWSGPTPVAFWNQDVPTTYPRADSHGTISAWAQQTELSQHADFEPREIIHFTMGSPRPGVFGIGLVELLLQSVTTWLFAAACEKEMLRKGLPPNVHADLPAGQKGGETERWRNQYASQNLGARNLGQPVITHGGGKITELQSGKLADVLQAKKDARDEIVAGMGVPPAKAGIIESGNLGGGTGDDQDRTYRIDTCGPIAAIVTEKLNFSIAKRGFGVQDWHTKFAEIDYRSSAAQEQIRINRIITGLWTLNRGRRDVGEPPVDGGDEPMYASQRYMILYRDLPAFSAATVQGAGALEPPPPSGPGWPGSGQDGDPETAAKAEAYRAAVHSRFREGLARYRAAVEAEEADGG